MYKYICLIQLSYKSFHAAQITELYIIIHVQNTHEHIGHLLNMRQGECKQQQPYDDDDVDGIFIAKVKI